MPTKNELAQQYAQEIRDTKSQEEIGAILKRIEKITYEGKDETISLDDQESLLTQILNVLDSYVIKTFDNKNYLALINHMLQQIRAKKK